MRIPGRTVIDGIILMRMFAIKLPNYSLETAGNVLLGEGKLITAQAQEKITEIEDLFKNDKPKLADYNMQDAALVDKIFKHLGGIEYQTNKAVLCGVPLEKVSTNLDLSESIYLPELHRRGYAAPNASQQHFNQTAPPKHLPPMSGLYEDVYHFEFDHLFSRLIQIFLIDPMGRQFAEMDPDNALQSPKGFSFHKTTHFLPAFFAKLERLRQSSQKKVQPLVLKAIDWVEENYLSQLFDSHNRFSSLPVISSLNNNLLHVLEVIGDGLSCGLGRLIYADKERLLIQSELGFDPLHRKLKEITQAQITQKYHAAVEIKLVPKHYFKQCFAIAENTKNMAFRFAGLKEDNEMIFHDLALTGSEYTAMAENFQAQLLDCLLRRQNPVDVLRSYKESVYQGEKDELAFYYRRLPKEADPQSVNAPPHVVAAYKRQPPQKSGWIHYAITTNGPEPKEALKSALDYDHYVETQLKSVAGRFLEHTAYRESIEELDPGEPQLSLFGT